MVNKNEYLSELDYLDPESRHLYQVCVENHYGDYLEILRALKDHPSVWRVILQPDQYEVYWGLPPHIRYSVIITDPVDYSVYGTKETISALLAAISRHAGDLVCRCRHFFDAERLLWSQQSGSA